MKILKTILSVIALLLGSAAGVTAFGDWHVSPAVTELMMAGAAFLGWMGISPIQISAPISRLCGAASIALMGFVAAHAGGAVRTQGPTVPLAFKVMGLAAVILGLVARGPIKHADPAPALSVPPKG